MLESTGVSVILFIVTCIMYMVALDNKLKMYHKRLLNYILLSVVIGVIFQLLSGFAQTMEILTNNGIDTMDKLNQTEGLIPVILSLLTVTIGSDVYSTIVERHSLFREDGEGKEDGKEDEE